MASPVTAPAADAMVASSGSSTGAEVSDCMQRFAAVVYGAGGSPSISAGEENTRVMSEKVQHLAASIYREFEAMIEKAGEDSVKNLMPLVVNVLESLDMAYLEKEEMSVDLEMLKEDNEQLITQYEREKQLRKAQDTKYLEIEDNLIGQNKDLEGKIESLESIMRMLELKSKNAADHANRLEEREADLKAEFDRLHERYNVLLRTHIDHMERTKYLMGSDKFEMMNNMPVPGQQIKTRLSGMATSVDASALRGVSDLITAHMSQSTSIDVNLANHISNEVDYQEEFGMNADVSPRDMGPVTSPQAKTPQKEQPEMAEMEKSEGERARGTERGVGAHDDSLPERQPIEADDSLGADLTDSDTTRSSLNAAGQAAVISERVNASFEDSEDDFIGDILTRESASDDPTGMGREVENLIKENTELMDMKNALNIVKNDLIAQVDELHSEQAILRDEVRTLEMVRAKMGEQMKELEAELRSVKQKLSEKENESTEEGDNDVPLSQRKRFTRYEMQRVLMERNKYKERLMELEETVRWSEQVRAKKAAAGQQQNKNKGGIWEFFSGLFVGDSAGSSTSQHATRRGRNSDPLSRKTTKMTRSADFIDPDVMNERRAAERREQYKIVRERVRKATEGRPETCGWSISPDSIGSSGGAPAVPVPVCCRPLLDQQPALKVWAAAGVVLAGGKLADGSYVADPVSTVFVAQKESESPTAESESGQQSSPSSSSSHSAHSSSLMWVGSSHQGRSHVAILDANNPNNVVDAFHLCDSHLLAIAGVPGVFETDPTIDEIAAKAFLRGGGHVKDIPAGLDAVELGCVEWADLRKMEDSEDGVETLCTNDLKPSPKRSRDFSVSESTIAVDTATDSTDDPANLPRRVGRAALPPHIRDSMVKYDPLLEKSATLDTVQPTVWLGSQNQYIYIHSAISEWRKCLRRIKMPDAVLAIVYLNGRVFAALANGSIAIFHRNKAGAWSDEGYHVLLIGRVTNSVRTLTVVDGRVWAAYRNCVVIVNPETLEIESAFEAHPRKDSQVRTMQCAGAGVWLAIRLDSTLRLFHSRTHMLLQDLDIEPYITKVLGSSRLDFSYIRTTALLLSNRRLWIGTGTGVIISIPLSDSNEQKVEGAAKAGGPGGLVRVYSAPKAQGSDESSASQASAIATSSSNSIPYCNLSQAQFSFHGHKDTVKFFLAVPGEVTTELEEDDIHRKKVLVISGGDGYIDFRAGEDDEHPPPSTATEGNDKRIRTRDMSHLIIWEVDAEGNGTAV